MYINKYIQTDIDHIITSNRSALLHITWTEEHKQLINHNLDLKQN